MKAHLAAKDEHIIGTDIQATVLEVQLWNGKRKRVEISQPYSNSVLAEALRKLAESIDD